MELVNAHRLAPKRADFCLPQGASLDAYSGLLLRIYPGTMESSRLPRFKRASSVPVFEITERDHEIIQLVHAHRFLRSSHLCALIPTSPQQILRRLKLLYHHGFLERPRAQLAYYHRGGSRRIIYGLGNKGAALLKQELGESIRTFNWNDKNGSVKGVFLEHALLVSDIMVAIDLASRAAGIRLLAENDLASERKAFRWSVNLNERVKLGIVPDRAFALEFPDQNGATERAYFFLEADRGTMPVIRKNLFQTSFYRKLLAYEATWAQLIHQRRFGFHRFRVLAVTTSPARRDALIGACSKLKSGHGLFLFRDQSVLERPTDILTALWHTGRKGETTRLLD